MSKSVDADAVQPVKSAEYLNFEALLKQVANVPKAEVDRSIQAEKDAKKQKQDTADTK